MKKKSQTPLQFPLVKKFSATKSITIVFHKAAVLLTLQQSPQGPSLPLLSRVGYEAQVLPETESVPGTEMLVQSQLPNS